MQSYEDDGRSINVSFVPENDNLIVFKYSISVKSPFCETVPDASLHHCWPLWRSVGT
ncbi:hypothetical protein [Albibacterium sp.]|uniref:hypothetical protein n=1 Tax=Albibacterium sp. TaxID=2952885 RepID=UPI002C62F31B|nr:hypothetical protein [Albibacterium sp.]HUH18107.1 hypothetical protein [Albibacterium sp.]